MTDQNERYDALTRLVRAGNRLPAATVRRVLAAAGKTADDFLDDTCAGTADRPVSGDPCPDCDGTLIVLDSRIRNGRRYRRLGCRSCGHRPARNLLVTTE